MRFHSHWIYLLYHCVNIMNTNMESFNAKTLILKSEYPIDTMEN